jgi:hypothetical protein
MPDPTDFVTDLPADFEIFGDAVDATVDTIDDRVTDLEVITTEGDLIVGDASGDPAALPIGAAGTVLTSDGDTAEWAPVSGGGMTLLSTTALTGAAVTVSGISGSFKNLQIVMRNVSHAVNGGYPLILPNGSGSISESYQVSSYIASTFTINRNAEIRPTNARGTVAASSYDVVVNIYDYANTVSPKLVDFVAGYEDTGGATAKDVVNGKARIRTNSAITSLEFNAQSSNFDAGSVLIYGVS